MAQQIFNFTFTVRAPLNAVADFHRDTRALRWLTPPPMLVQLHHIEPLAEGSLSEFTLWFGVLPIRWLAVHTNVKPPHGFTDTQQKGMMKFWQHTHTFSAETAQVTRVREHIEYEHDSGWHGLLTRLLFAPPALWFLFFYRSLVTRWRLER